MASLNHILREAGDALQKGDRHRAGILLNQALSLDFTRERTWVLLYHLLGKPTSESLEDFKRSFSQRYYPDKTHLLEPERVTDAVLDFVEEEPKSSELSTPLIHKQLPPTSMSRFGKHLWINLFKRLGFGLLVLGFIIFLSYSGLDMARGVPSKVAVWDGLRQTGTYILKAIQLDFGDTASGTISLLPAPIVEVIPEIVIRSLGLLGVSLVLAASFGIIIGIWVAGRRSGLSTLVLLASIIGISVPSFFAALLLQIGVIKLTQATGRAWLPTGGYGWDKHLVLPALVLAARPLAQITRVTFVTIEEILSQDFVRTAHGKGLTPRSVMYRHIVKNAAVPVLTTVGLSFRFSLGSLPVVEYFFGWQGIGFTLLKSISQQDDNLTIALALCMGILFILVNLILDLIYPLIDPRLRDVADHVLHQEQRSLSVRIKDFALKFRVWFNQNVINRLRPKKSKQALPTIFDYYEKTQEGAWDELNRPGRRKTWLQATLGNLPLVLGFILVFVILFVIVFGPDLAPHSPYTTQGLTIVDGEFIVPPFEPDETYPWGTDVLGRDVLSLVLAGAQQTFILVVSIVTTRLVIGFITGAIAGWFRGSWVDRLILSIAEIISAFPALLTAMVLILAIGIRRGMQTFVIALCFVGWMEIMQFVRSQVIITRPKRFIESALATGAGNLRIVWRHILPNLIPSLISILSLETGAVLMLLGELGFIGIFIGGGAFAELDVFGALYHYSDVPEWGALLSGVRTYARSYPWMAIYPVIAFFVSIAGFNLLGEGIRRLIEKVGVEVTRIFFNRYAFAAVVLAGMGLMWLRGTTGEAAYFQEQAQEFDVHQAMGYLNDLTAPDFDGRALGTEGMDETADYIAQEFENLGLQAAGETFTYFQTKKRTYEQLNAIPSMEVDDGGSELVYNQDFIEYSGRYLNRGVTHAPVRLVQFGDLMSVGYMWREIPALHGLDYSNEILMVLSEQEAVYLERIPKAGLLVVTDHPELLTRRITLSSRDPYFNPLGTNTEPEREFNEPAFRISEDTANRLLAKTGKTVEELRFGVDKLGLDEIYEIETHQTARLEVDGAAPDAVEVRHVIGHLPGVAWNVQNQLDNQLIVVLAQYDTPPLIPGIATPPAANDNASGLAIMLETIRNMQASGYQPYKTFLFIAYSAEGLEGGENVYPEVSKFLQTKFGFSEHLNVEAIVDLRGLGTGDGNKLQIAAGGSLRLANLLEKSAKRMGLRTTRVGEQIDMSVVFKDTSGFDGGDEAPHVGIHWDGWENTSMTSADTLDTIQSDILEEVGQVVSLFLMTLGRDTTY